MIILQIRLFIYLFIYLWKEYEFFINTKQPKYKKNTPKFKILPQSSLDLAVKLKPGLVLHQQLHEETISQLP